MFDLMDMLMFSAVFFTIGWVASNMCWAPKFREISNQADKISAGYENFMNRLTIDLNANSPRRPCI